MDGLTGTRARGALITAITLMVVLNTLSIAVLWDRTQTEVAQAPTPTPTPTTSVLGETFPPPSQPPIEPEAPPVDDVVEPPDVPVVAPPPPASRCFNSYDPACGRLFWDPEPGRNEPLTLDAWFAPDEPVAGEPITFTVRATDPDARPKCCDHAIHDGEAMVTLRQCLRPKYGRWEPPAKKGGTRTDTLTRTFDEPGSYAITFSGRSGGGCPNPYSSSAAVTITFVVGET